MDTHRLVVIFIALADLEDRDDIQVASHGDQLGFVAEGLAILPPRPRSTSVAA
ncbi:MAG: hypothetical protein J5I81_00025 [Nitrococcus mobilis]|nr:hypothetical protein [Nitrococcus mobilis]